MRNRFWNGIWVSLMAPLLLAGCGPKTDSSSSTTPVSPTSESQVTETPEYRWSQLLGRDDIRPIYEPEFVPADDAGYDDNELVMGVAINGEAKAYPVGLLNSREMVNDELAGIPVLVTW